MVRILTGGVIVLAAFLIALTTAQAQGGKEVKVTYSASKPDADGKQVITINMDIAKSWYAYANPVGLEDFASNATKVSVTSNAKPEEVKIEYPAGKEKKDAIVGNYKIYEDKAEIKAIVRRAKGDKGPLTIEVSYSVCNAKTGVCLLPETVKLTVP